MAIATNGKAATPILMEIPPLRTKVARLHIVGESPLICHRWSDKARKEINDKQQGAAREKKAPKVPQQEYEAAFYRCDNGNPGFPAIAFKCAAVDAATAVSGLTKVALRQAFHTVGELVEIEGEPRMREDMVRIAMGTADVRYRPEFPEWSTMLTVQYNAASINLEQLIHLFNAAGFGVGIGEWRPERNGTNGRFRVKEIEEVG